METLGFYVIIDNKRLFLDWKLLSATVTIRVSCPYMIWRTNVLLGEGENQRFQYAIATMCTEGNEETEG